MNRIVFLLLLFSLHEARANEVPDFRPNVVDEARALSESEVREINDVLLDLRSRSDIWGAVYLVRKLQNDSIESLADKAFSKWKLGDAQEDNGLLLLLALDDRKSRFHVGYGLEGDLTDANSRRVLDEVLAPLMRQKKIKAAIIESFDAMGQLKGSVAKPAEKSFADEDFTPEQHFRGRLSLLIFLICLWIVPAISRLIALKKSQKLKAAYPEYLIRYDDYVNQGKFSAKKVFFKGWPFRLFFSVNPGCFFYFGAAVVSWLLPVFMVLGCIYILVYLYLSLYRFFSHKGFQDYINEERKRIKGLLDKGYMVETAPGKYRYTPSYYSSSEYSSSSGSSSSSSGGGSSGGGGASSGW